MQQYTNPLYSAINTNRGSQCEHKTMVLIYTGIKDGKTRKQCMECGKIRAYKHVDDKITMEHPEYMNSIYTNPYRSSVKTRKKERRREQLIQPIHCIICGINNMHHMGMSHPFQTSMHEITSDFN